MHDFLRSTGRRLRAGWFCPLALVLSLLSGLLFELPGCALWKSGLPGQPPFDGGQDRTGAVMCDIPAVWQPGFTGCADQMEAMSGMSRSYAAVALVQGESNSLALDFSQPCPNGLPGKTKVEGAFPAGTAACLDCGMKIPVPFQDDNAVCVAWCIDLVNSVGFEPPEGTQVFCQKNAQPSPNFDKTTAPNSCFDNACSMGGTPLPTCPANVPACFAGDTRRCQEPVTWTDLKGTAPQKPANTLMRNIPTSATPAGAAASGQLIMTGDGWVEFGAGETGLGHAVGLSAVLVSPCLKPPPNLCPPPDDDASLMDMDFGLLLQPSGDVFILEGGNLVSQVPVATYNKDDRFRVRVTDNNDGTATITYWQLTAPCTDPATGELACGTICAAMMIGQQSPTHPKYPLRVDAFLNDFGATLTNVTLVRIRRLNGVDLQ